MDVTVKRLSEIGNVSSLLGTKTNGSNTYRNLIFAERDHKFQADVNLCWAQETGAGLNRSEYISTPTPFPPCIYVSQMQILKFQLSHQISVISREFLHLFISQYLLPLQHLLVFLTPNSDQAVERFRANIESTSVVKSIILSRG